jgi:hypothetical protein
MQKLRLLAFIVIGVLVAFAMPTNVKADPLLFSNVGVLQNNNTNTVDLFSNPGATVIGQELTFRVDITGTLPAGVSNTLLVIYQATGSAAIVQTFEIPLFGSVDPPFTHLFTIPFAGATPQGTAVTLTIDIIGSAPDFVIPAGPNAGQRVDSYTYNFNVAQPIPEPASIIILGTGLAGLLSRLRRNDRS